jgi:mannose-6-phosphate isomerase-like protein (cupin superfamily)
MTHKKQTSPSAIPVPGGKLIEEHFGKVATGEETVSIAHMVAPSGWSEPPQRPEFDEYTLMVRGKKQVEIEGEPLELKAGESLLVSKGTLVRYSNPFGEEAEYWSVCIPAFSPDRVNRSE